MSEEGGFPGTEVGETPLKSDFLLSKILCSITMFLHVRRYRNSNELRKKKRKEKKREAEVPQCTADGIRL